MVWMVSIFPLISSSPSLFSRSWGTVPMTQTTIGINITFIFYSFFSFLARSRYLSSFSISFVFTLRFTGMAESSWWQVLFCLLINIRSDFSWGFGGPFRFQSPREFYESHFLGQISITFHTQSCLLLYSFCASMLHSLVM